MSMNCTCRSAAVFFVPSGRESEYQFSTPGGLATVAEQAGCRRLLVIRCNRPHEFPTMDLLQVGEEGRIAYPASSDVSPCLS